MDALVLPDGRVIDPHGPLGKRLVAAHVRHMMTCLYCGKQHQFLSGLPREWRR